LRAFELLIDRGLVALQSQLKHGSKLNFAEVRVNFFERELSSALKKISAHMWMRHWLVTVVNL